MFRILGALVIALLVGGGLLLYVEVTYVAPRLRRKRMERLEAEHRELDRQLAEILEEKGRGQ